MLLGHRKERLNMKKRLLSIIMTAALIVQSLCMMTVSAENATLTGSGTIEDPYRIGNKNHLVAFANLVKSGETGACALVTADITDNAFINGAAQIATTQDAPYTGTFDGAGHTIKLNHGGGGSYKGLFAYIKNATVKNVNITGSVGGQQALAGIAAVAESSLIENCTNSATIFDASNGSWAINDSA